MSRSSGRIWWIIVIVVLLVVVLVGLSKINKGQFETDDDELEKRRIQEEKLLKEIEVLEKKNELYEDHKWKMEFTDQYLETLSEKRYRQVIRAMILFGVVCSLIIYFAVPGLNVLEIIGLNGAILICFNACLGIAFVYVAKAKERIKEFIKAYIDSRVYRNRDTKYFKDKIEFYEAELLNINNEISYKTNELEVLKNEEIKD